jgi:signal transduction histidine kinase
MPTLLGLQPPTLLQSVLDGVGAALVVIDRERRFVFANQSARTMLGIPQNLNGLSLIEWRRNYKFQDIQGREIPVENAPITRLLAGETVEPQDLRVTLPDGRVKWLHAAGLEFSVLGLDGVFAIITDETEQVELRHAVEQIQHIEAVSLLAGTIAHNFNNMLSVASGNIALALSDPGISAETLARLQQAKQALHKSSALANKLTQFSRPREIQLSPVDVNAAVNASVELVRPLLGSRVRLKLDLVQEGLPIIQGDLAELEQALVNLMMNSLDAMPQGGELTVSTGLVPAATSKGKEARGFVSIAIADTGIGIPEHLQGRVFEPFFTTKSEGRGSGLGLSSTYYIIRQHTGHIKVESAPGAGTTFTVFLPVKDAA